jgi:photosystem II oxygen-evolving enhancer protein 1
MARFAAVILALALGAASAFVPARVGSNAAVTMSATSAEHRAAAAAAAALLTAGIASPALAITAEERAQLSYLQVKGTGLANRCSEVKGSDSLSVKSGAKLVDFCLEPKAFFVEQTVSNSKGDVKTDFVATKLMTRQTYTLDGISGSFSDAGGKLKLTEEDGIDYAPTTVQTPGGERVPFLFTVKQLVATGAKSGSALKPGFEFGGSFTVPSYRTGLFLDPKGRGMSTGYDMAVALPGLQSGVDGDDEMFNENNKVFDVLKGSAEFEVQNVNAAESEFGGVFVSAQPSDTDLGGKEPKKLLLMGIFFGKIEQ